MSIKLTWYGHAALALNIDGTHVLVDPFLSDNPATDMDPNQIQSEYILISHGHNDHLGDTEKIAKRTKATIITNFEISNWLQRRGLQTHAQHIGGGHQYPFGYVKFTQALHGSCMPDGSYGGNPAGFLITTPDQHRIYLAGDTGLFGDMRLIGEEGVDLAVLPIGDNFTMGPADALRAVKLIQPKHVIPIHYDTWELIAQDSGAWAEQVSRETGAQVHVLKPGETFTLG